MLFSVITITFNAEKYLKGTLDSAVGQTFSDFEHILWDGGSTDSTLHIAKKYTNLAIYEGKDMGIADAMNKAAFYAKGRYFIFLHADDFFASPDTLQIVATALKQHPIVEWLYGRAHFTDQEGKVRKTTPFEFYSAKRLRTYNFLTHPSVCVSRNLFNKANGFDPTLRYCMDYDLWLKLSNYAHPFALPFVLSCFREHEKSTSTAEPLQVAAEAYRVRKRYMKNFLERFRSFRTWKKRIKNYV